MIRTMHYAQAARKCLLHSPARYVDAMATAGERLKQAREKAGYSSAASAADAMGVKPATYAQHENGLRGYPASKAERYGRFFRVAPEWLLYGKTRNGADFVSLGPQLYVKGEVAAGVWRDAWEFDPDEWEVFTGRSDVKAPPRERFGLRVIGDSMNEIYPHGSIIECIAYIGDYEIPSGKRVVVKRTRHDGSVEATVKELIRTDDGVEWFRPRSTNPQFLAFRGDQPEDPSIARVEIIGIVVASIRPE
jgi:SOS-response transcriptional repressor LexA